MRHRPPAAPRLSLALRLCVCLCAATLPGCAFLGDDPGVPTGDAPSGAAPAPVNDGGLTPPPGVVFDGGPGAAAYLGCRQKAIDSGVANAANIGTVDQACVAQAQTLQ